MLSLYISIAGAAEAIDYYKKVFGAREVMRLADPSGKVAHAELDINGANLMLSDEFPEYGAVSPKSIGGSPVTLCLSVPNVDEVTKVAVEAGAKLLRPPTDEFYGERAANIEDPFGHKWMIMTHVEDVSNEEIQRRFKAMCA